MEFGNMQWFEQAVNAGLEKMKVPGLTVAVVQDGRLVYQNAFGYADVEQGVPMAADNVLPVGSATKTLTATAVAMLAAQGKLDLDKPLLDYLPGFRMVDDYATAQATPRDILCHRTGLPRHDLVWLEREHLTRRGILERLRYLQPSVPFRSKWQYQNLMYAVAGCLVDEVAGVPYEAYVAQHILAPLGMEDTNFDIEACVQSGRLPTLYSKDAAGVCKPCAPLRVGGAAPAGGANATVADLARWVGFHMSGGNAPDGECLLAPPFFAQLHQPNIPYQLLPYDFDGVVRQGYGLGWFVDSFRGEKLVEHGGNVDNATAFVSLLPEKGIGIAVMANVGSTQLPKALSYLLYDKFLGTPEKVDWIGVVNEKIEWLKGLQYQAVDAFCQSGLGKPMVHSPEEYAGTYAHPAYGTARIEADGGRLRFYFHGREYPLVHLHYDIFYFIMHELPVPISVSTGMDGRVNALLMDMEGSLPLTEFVAQP